MSTDPQLYRVEVRYDFYGTREELETVVGLTLAVIGETSEVTAIWDEDWNEV